MAHLEFFSGDTPLFVHLLKPGRTLIGRSDSSDMALPSERVSRTHCIVERRMEGWWLTDKSSHGTYMNGEVIGRHQLKQMDVFEVGPYRVQFVLNASQGSSASQVLWRQQRSATTVTRRAAADHEELVDVSDVGITVQRGLLEFTKGSLAGKTVLLTAARTSLGGQGAQVVLEADWPRNALRIRVVRGRVMIEPGEHPCFLAGIRVREITPARKGEEVVVGAHGFVVQVQTTATVATEPTFGEMIGTAPAMRQVFGLLSRVSAHTAPVLLTGESGTGKELAARGIHTTGPRAEGAFVAINCAGIPEALFESELFGHEKGAFTGATKQQDGAFHRAHNGCIFLDEIGEIPLNAQAKLLRVLESGEVRRVGSHDPSFPDVRVIAATNRNLAERVKEGLFRADLYFRLAVLTIRLPALRDRASDIRVLAHLLVKNLAPDAQLTEAAVAALGRYHWPGNVRELRNVLTRAYVLGGPEIGPENLSFNPWTFDDTRSPDTLSKVDLAQQEKEAIVLALQESNGNKSQAARSLGLPRSSLIYKMERLQIG